MKRLLWAIPALLVLALWASTSPDGLQWVVGQAGAPEAGHADRAWRFLAGLGGCLAVYALALLLQRRARRRRTTSTPPAAPPRR